MSVPVDIVRYPFLHVVKFDSRDLSRRNYQEDTGTG